MISHATAPARHSWACTMRAIPQRTFNCRQGAGASAKGLRPRPDLNWVHTLKRGPRDALRLEAQWACRAHSSEWERTRGDDPDTKAGERPAPRLSERGPTRESAKRPSADGLLSRRSLLLDPRLAPNPRVVRVRDECFTDSHRFDDHPTRSSQGTPVLDRVSLPSSPKRVLSPGEGSHRPAVGGGPRSRVELGRTPVPA
jgi:hypothetical protein